MPTETLPEPYHGPAGLGCVIALFLGSIFWVAVALVIADLWLRAR